MASPLILLLVLSSSAVTMSATSFADDADTSHPGQPGQRLEIFLVRLQATGEEKLMRARISESGEIFLPRSELARWRIRIPAGLADEEWLALTSLGLSHSLDEGRQELNLSAGSAAYEWQRLDAHPTAFREPERPTLGAFVNYSLHASFYEGIGAFSGSLDLGLFSRWGVLESRWLALDLTGEGALRPLETTWTLDLPGRAASWRVGDDVADVGRVARPSRFLGVRYTSDYSIRPDLVTYPVPTLSGSASLPSVVEVFAEGALRYSQRVAPGPFEIVDLPMVTGGGQVEMVVTDAAGRRRVIQQPFYVSPSLLRRGARDFSVQSGWLRRGFGQSAPSYGDLLVGGYYRRGLSDRTTVELGGFALADRQSVTFSAGRQLARLGILEAGLVGSHGVDGSALGALLGFHRHVGGVGLSWTSRINSRHHVELDPSVRVERLSHRFSASYSHRKFGNLALAAAANSFLDSDEDRELYSLSYSRGLGKRALFTVGASRVEGERTDTRIKVAIGHALGGGRRVTVGHRQESRRQGQEISFLRAAPVGPGLGYRLRAETGSAPSVDGSFSLAMRKLSLFGRGERRDDRFSGAVEATGAVAWLGGELHLARRLSRSFALIRVPETPGVAVYQENHRVGRTGRSGSLLIPNLRPYEVNRLRIEGRDLPLDVRIDSLERETVPFDRSGVVVEFEVDASIDLLVVVRQANGELVPAGATARLDGDLSFPVGYRGQLYVTGLSPAGSSMVEIRWPDGECGFTLHAPAARGSERLTAVTCQ